MWWCWSSSHMALSWCDRANKAEWPILLTISCRLPGQQVSGGWGEQQLHIAGLYENCPFQGFKLLWHSYDALKCLKCRMLLPDCKGDQAGMRCFYTVGEISALWPRHVTHRQEPSGEIHQGRYVGNCFESWMLLDALASLGLGPVTDWLIHCFTFYNFFKRHLYEIWKQLVCPMSTLTKNFIFQSFNI